MTRTWPADDPNVSRSPRVGSRARGLARVLAAVGVLLLASRSAHAQNVRTDLVMTNGQVNAEVAWGGKLYIAGSFTNVGPATGGGVPVDTTAGGVVAGFPRVAGVVNTAVPDSAGGWYVGGAFTTIGGVPRHNLAHVLPDLSVAPWDPSPDQPVFALAFHGGAVYAGGDFATIGGQSRARLAAIDSSTGLATGWDPGANASVRALVATDSVVYAGGDFTSAGGQARNRVAALDVVTAAATAWDPNSNGSVYCMDAGGGVVYAGGFFSSIGGQSRVDLAALDASTGLATAWNPRPDNQVFSVVLAGSRLYVGGAFTKFSLLTPRNRIAALDVVTGAAVPGFDPNANGRVLALWANGAAIYAGGEFTTLGGQPRTFVAAVDSLTGGVTPWNPTGYGPVYALAPGGASLYVGGSFNGIGGAVRNNIAQVDLASGALTAWNPNANGQVIALAPRSGVLYAGGQFSSIGGAARNNVAALDVSTGLATAWDAGANNQVSALAVSNGVVYAGGTFSSFGGQPRNNLAAADTATGAATAWDPNVNGQVFTIVPSAGVLYFGGSFSNVGGQSRKDAAAVSVVTGVPTAFDPNSNGTLRALAASCGTIYASGFFTTIGGQSRNRVAQLDPATGAATTWDANADGPTLALQLTGGALYASGVFGQIGGQPRLRIAALDPVTGLATAWNPGADNLVRAFAIDGQTIYAGGAFGSISGQIVSNLAGLTADTTLFCPSITLAPGALAGGRTGVAYAQSVSASGASAPYCYAVSAGALPPGISLDPSSGQLAGTPTTSGTYNFTIAATTVSGCRGTRAYSIALLPGCPSITVGPPSLALAHVGVAVADTFTASAGTPPLTFTVSAGALPAGLTLAADGTLTGTPTALGTASFSVQVADSIGCSATRAYTLYVFPACAPLAVGPELLKDGVVGAAYDDTLKTAGGHAPYTWTVSAGSLPPGLALDAATGRLHGTPSLADTFAVTFTATDSIGCGGAGAYTLAIFATAPGSTIAAVTSGLAITNGHATARVPVVFGRAESDSVASLHVVVQIDPARFALVTPALPDSSIRPGGWLDAAPGAGFHVTNRGGGSFSVDIALVGAPCGLPQGGTLFTLDLAPAGADGSGAISVTSVRARDCAGAIVPVAAGAPATLLVDRAPLVLAPAALPGGVVGQAYARTLTTLTGTAPVTYTVVAGTLPAGVVLNGATGQITGAPTGAGASYFTLRADDALGRFGTRAYGVNVFAGAPVSFVTPGAPACLTAGAPHVAVPFDYQRGDSVPERAVSVTLRLDPSRLALLTPGNPAASFHPGAWFGAFSNTTFFVTDNGGGSYTVDLALLGSPCGITTGGRLFTVDVAASGPDGPASVTVQAVRARDCVNAAVQVAEGPDAVLTIDRNGPAHVSDLAAVQQAVAGASGQTTSIALTWTASGGGELYRAPYGTYPLYADAATRPDSALAPGGPWTHIASNPAPGYVDQPPARGVWSYLLVVSDSCGATSVSNETAGTLDYLLADVSDATTPGTGNNSVNVEDVSLLGAHYGITGAAAVDPYGYLDVGPTSDGTPNGRPLPDHQVDFEDLLVFAESFGVAVGPPASTIQLAVLGRPAGSRAAASDAPESFSVTAPSLVDVGDDVVALVHVAAQGRMLGFSARLAWDKNVVQPLATEGTGLVESQGGLVLSSRPGSVDAAVLGHSGVGLTGEGDVARVRFRVLRKGLADIKLDAVDARDTSNRRLTTDLSVTSEAAVPGQTVLLAPAPNPALGASAIAFTLAQPGSASLRVFAVNGRLVRTLESGVHPAGVYHVRWDGRDQDGRVAAAGVYFFQLEAGGRRMSRSLVLLK